MANTRFKTENGLLVTGGNAQFDDVVRMNANLTVDADLILVTGDLQVQGAQIFTGGQLYTSDIVADVDGLNIANTTNQFNAFLGTVRVFDGLFPQGNTLPLGNSTSRFVITANTLNLSGNAAITGNLTVSNTMSVTGAVTLGNTLSVTNTVTLSNTLSVTGAVTLSNTLAVTGAATLSNTIAVTGAGTLSNTLAVTGAVTLGNTLAVTNTVTLSNTLSVTGAATLSNTLAVTGSITGSANVNIDSGVLFVDATNNRVGINNTAPGVALRVTGAADFSSTANIQGNANVGGNLGVAAAATVDGNVSIGGNLMVTNTTRTHHISGNSSFSGGTLFINSVESRVGIGTSTPDVTLQVVGSANVTGASRFTNTVTIVGALSLGNTLSVTNSVTLSNTLSIAGAANALSTFGISGQANALGSLGVNGLLTAAAGLTVTGITNTSSAFNVGGGVATTNGASISTTSIAVGNTTSYTNIQPIKTTTFIPVASQEAQIAYANSTGALWFYQAYAHQTSDSWSLNRADGTTYLSTLLAAYRGNNSLLFNANAIAMVGNVNIDSGTLYVDALNNRVGINNTAPGVALRVTGAVDISSTSNVQGNANVGGTLGAAGLITAAAGLTVTGTINASANLNVGTYATGVVNGVNVTNNALLIGNNTANAILTGSSLSINATSATLNVGTSFTVNSSLVNAVAFNVGTAATINTVGITHTGFVNAAGSVNSAILRVGTAAIINTTGVTHTGFVNATGSVNSAILSVGTSAIINSTGVFHTGTMNSASYTVGTIGVSNGINITTSSIVAGNLAVILGNSTVNTVITGNSNARGRRTIVANSSTPNGPQDVNASPQNGDIVYIY